MARKSKSKLDYFEAFAKQSELAANEAEVLIDIINNFTSADAVKAELPRAHEIEHKADKVYYSILAAVDVDFITPIEREDIIELALKLDDLVDSIEDVAQNFYIYNITEMHPDCIKFAEWTREACLSIAASMEDFANFKKSDAFKAQLSHVKELEEKADALYMESAHALFASEDVAPKMAFIWKDILASLEHCTDCCMEVADTIGSIALKNS